MVEDAVLKYLGIYPESIQRADEIVERVCGEYGIDSDSEVWPYVEQAFTEEHGKQLGNEIIGLAFRNLEAALVESGKVSEGRIAYDVNSLASFFVVEGES